MSSLKDQAHGNSQILEQNSQELRKGLRIRQCLPQPEKEVVVLVMLQPGLDSTGLDASSPLTCFLGFPVRIIQWSQYL